MSRWVVNGVDLGSYATNVSNASAGWSVPGKRGSNLDIPGQDGSRWTPNKPYDEGSIHLSMWALGCLPDGSMPTDRTRAALCKQNLERLFSLFTPTANLCEVVRIDSAGYGSVNLFPNPANETVLPGGTGYKNKVPNPAAITQTQRPAVTNLLPDPSLRTLTGFSQYSENIVMDPYSQKDRPSGSAILNANLFPYPNFEAPRWTAGTALTATQWVVGANTTAVIASTGYYGKSPTLQSLQVTATAGLAVNASLGRLPPTTVGGGATGVSGTGGGIDARMKIRRLTNITTARGMQGRILYYDSAKTQIGVSSWSATYNLPSGNTTWTTFQFIPDVTRPGGTAYVGLEFRTTTTMNSGEGYLLDAVSIGDHDSPRSDESAPYFNGYNNWAVFRGTADQSVSEVWGCLNKAWTVGTLNAYYAYALSTQGDAAGTSVGFVANREGTGGSQTFTLDCAAATVGTPYTLRFTAMALAGVNCTVELCTRTSGVLTSRGSVAIVGEASSAPWDSTPGLTGTWSDYSGPTWTPTSGQTLVVRVTVPVTFAGDVKLLIKALAVTDSYFIYDGNTTDTTNTHLDWAGTAYLSKTINSARRATTITGLHVVNTTQLPYSYAQVTCRVSGEQTRITFADITPNAAVLNNGFSMTCLAFGNNHWADNLTPRQPALRAVVVALNGGTTLATYTGPTQFPVMNAPGLNPALTLSVSSPTLPPTTDTLRCYIEEIQPGSGVTLPFVGSTWGVAQPMLLDHYSTSPTPFFDGSSGGVWGGAANNSPSSKMLYGPAFYTVEQGMQLVSGTGYITATGSGTSDVSVGVTLDQVGPAGQYRLGAEVSCAGADCDVWFQAMNGNTLLAQIYAGSIRNSDLGKTERLQATLDVASPIQRIRVRFVRTTSVALQVRVAHTYAFSIADSHLPRIAANYLVNPTWGRGSSGWAGQAGKTLSVISTSFGRCLSTSGNVLGNANRIAATSGQQVFCWAKVQSKRTVQLQVNWFNSSGTLIGTGIAVTSNPDDQLRTIWGTATAPASTAWGTVQVSVTGWKSGDVTNLYAAYATLVIAARDYGDIAPDRWAYFDGSTTADYLGNATQWDGPVNSSASSTLPVVPKWWQPGPTVALLAPPYRPPNSTGKALAFPGFANATPITPPSELGAYSGFLSGFTEHTEVVLTPDPLPSQTMQARTVPFQRIGNYLSGEIALARNSVDSIVTVRVVTCDDQLGSNEQVQWEDQMEGLAQIVTWRDLGVGNNWYFIEVEYFETSPNPGYALVADNLLILDTDQQLLFDYPFYFDGSRSSAIWNGDPHDSTSTYFAGARRCYAEFVETITPSSMAGGTRAEMEVVGSLPESFWEDLAPSHFTGLTADPDTDFVLQDWAGSTARNTSCVITLTVVQGSAPAGYTLYDKKTGAWIKITQALVLGDSISIDCAKFSVKATVSGVTTSIMPNVVRGGGSPLLALTPYSVDIPPILRLVTDASYDGVLQVTVTGRRKYVIA